MKRIANKKATFTVCYFGTYRKNYSRNQIMIAGLRLNGVNVIECHETLWQGIEDREAIVKGDWKKPSFWWRATTVYFRLLRKFFKIRDFDILIVGYPGQLDVFLAWLLSRMLGKPLVWDVFMSIYLISLERNLDKQGHFIINLLRLLERVALRLPNLLIQDTQEYVNWLEKTHHISQKNFRLVPTGADDRIFKPMSHETIIKDVYNVLYYGTFIPNHGVQYIIEAARVTSAMYFILFIDSCLIFA